MIHRVSWFDVRSPYSSARTPCAGYLRSIRSLSSNSMAVSAWVTKVRSGFRSTRGRRRKYRIEIRSAASASSMANAVSSSRSLRAWCSPSVHSVSAAADTLASIAPLSPARRYRQVSQVLARHGLGFFISITGLERFVRFQRIFNRNYQQPLSRPEYVRRALDALGPTFIKLGQILSTRADLLPPSYQLELAKLQDAAPPLKTEVVTAIIATAFGRPVDEVFSSFSAVPLPCASVGQVQRAPPPAGPPVA